MASERAVVGLGNPYRRDDGVGPAVVDRLSKRDLPATDLLDLGDAGFELVHVLADYDAVVIVDAVTFDGDPGEIAVFEPEDAEASRTDRGTHRTDPFELLDLAERVEDSPATVRLVGVQPAATDHGNTFSPAVRQQLPEATDVLLDVLRSL